MLEPVATMRAPLIGVFPSAYQEKSQLQKSSVPVAKSYITKEKLEHAISEALKEVSSDSDSEKTAYVYYDESDVVSETYPSAPNGATEQSADGTANTIGFFDNLTGKAQKHAKSTFPNCYKFLEKAFSKKPSTPKDAFAAFDNIRSSLEKEEYKNLSGFEKMSDDTKAQIEAQLNKLKDRLDFIAEDFKDEWIYQIPKDKDGKELSHEDKELHIWYAKRTKVEDGLAALSPTVKSISAVIDSLENELPPDERSFLVRLTTSFATCIGYVVGLCGGVSTPLFAGALAVNLEFERRQFLQKQKVNEWKEFKKSLDELINKNPLVKGEVMNRLLGSNFTTQASIINTLEQMKARLDASEAEKVEIKSELKEVKTQYNQLMKGQEELLGQLADLKQMLNIAITSKA